MKFRKNLILLLCIFVLTLTTNVFAADSSQAALKKQVITFDSLKNTTEGISLSWTKEPNATGYLIYRKDSSGTFVKIANIKNNTITNYVDKKITTNKYYEYAIRGYNGKVKSIGAGQNISGIYFLSLKGFNLAASSASIEVNWKQNTKADGYEIKYNDNGQYVDKFVISNNTAASYTIKKLKEFNSYKVYIRCYKKYNNKKYYSQWIAKKCLTPIKNQNKDVIIAIAYDPQGHDILIARKLGALNIRCEIISSPSNVLRYGGLILPGGTDINPGLYNEGITYSSGVDSNLDSIQKNILRAFVNNKKPVLGVCRGCQFINVYFGGSLYQDIFRVFKHASVGSHHKVTVNDNTFLSKFYDKSITVNSLHHQAVKQLGKNLMITAKTADGVVEGIQHKTLPVYGVQWHPEIYNVTDGNAIFLNFLNVCKMYS